MAEYKTGFKVFSGVRTLKPATSAALQRIRYKRGEWVKQDVNDHGAFAVFTQLDAARRFLADGYGKKIHRVTYVKTDGVLWKKNPPAFTRSGGRYHAISQGITERGIDDCPLHTDFASALFVGEEIITDEQS